MPHEEELRTKGVFEEGGTPLYQFSQELGLRGPTTGELLGESRQITERRAGKLEEAGAEVTRQAKGAAELAKEQAVARERERPAPYTAPPTPSLEARPFLSPPQSVLGQLQTILVGIGQMATGFAGLKGKGYAIGATAALKGAVEGWQAGDADRAARGLEQWKVENDRLLQAHRSARERYQDILEDQTRTMQDRLSQIEMSARVAGMQDLAEAARSGDLDRVLKVVEAGKDREISVTSLAAQIQHYRALEAQARAAGAATQERLRLSRQAGERAEESGRRAEERLDIYKETAGGLIRLQKEEVGLTQKLQNADIVADAVALLDKEGVLPPGATVWDTARAKIVLQTKVGRRDIAWAVQTVQRLGVPILVGTEVALGMQGQTMRLKVVGEAEAGNVTGIPKSFWDQFLPNAKKALQDQRQIARQHLRALGRLEAPVELRVSPEEWERD